MIDVYLLMSNNYSCLNLQKELCEKYVQNLNKIYVVTGPFGDHPRFAENHYADIDGNVIVIPFDKRFIIHTKQRVREIVNYLSENYVKENAALVLHSDCFPMQKFEEPVEQSVSCGNRGVIDLGTTWIYFKPGFTIDHYLAVEKTYPSYFPSEKRFEEVYGMPYDGYKIQWLYPSFVHTDNSMIETMSKPEIAKKKVEFIHKYAGLRENKEFDESQILPQGVVALTKRYTHERKAWIEAGKPLRSREEIQRIFNICKECPFFMEQSVTVGSCAICGCYIKRHGTKMNKLAWSTTRCPKQPPEWIEEAVYTRFAEGEDPPNTQTTNKKCCGQ